MDLYVYYWKTINITEPQNYHTEVKLCCVDTDNRNVCVRVENVKSQFTLEFKNPDFLNSNFQNIKRILYDHIFTKTDRDSIRIVKKRKLYGFSECKTNFLEIKFTSKISLLSLMKKINNKIIDFGCEVIRHETHISSELEQMAEQSLYATGWVRINSYKNVDSDYKISRCHKEMFADKNSIVESSIKITPD